MPGDHLFSSSMSGHETKPDCTHAVLARAVIRAKPDHFPSFTRDANIFPAMILG